VSRVFITGGTGVIGTALSSALVARGDEIVGLARSEKSEQALKALGAETVRGDAMEEDVLVAGMRGCTVVFNVAGINSLCIDDLRPMQRLNVDGPVTAIRAAKRAGVKRFIHTSSAATIGEPAGTVATEQTVHRGWFLSAYERTKTEGERAAMRAAGELDLDLVCVNPSSVQGPGRTGGTARFLLAFLDGRLRVFVQTDVSMVDIADCVEGHLLAAEHGAAGERYLLSGIALTMTEALAIAGEVAGVRSAPRMVPRGLALAAAEIVERSCRLVRRRPPVCREMVRTLLHGHRYDGSRATRELGLRYTEPRETLRRTVEWARSEGLLQARMA
jgi:dihydroflavonol-4-reductase